MTASKSITPLLALVSLSLALGIPAFSQESASGDFETPPVFRASELLTPEQMAGPYHRVREEVDTNGVTNTYTIDSDFGVFVVAGDDLLPVRVREIYAIAAIRATKESDAYTRSLANAAKETVEGAKNLVSNPGKALSGMGKGAMRFMKGATERVQTMASDKDTAADLKKYSDARREIAGYYGVDPYTSNPVLRKEIDEIATASAAGNLTFSLATMAIPAKGIGIAAKGVNYSAQLNQILLEKGPYTLRNENRDRLLAMSLDRDFVDSFLNHPVLNPKHQTVIALALEKMKGARGRGTFIRLAMAARSEEDARFFAHGAALMALYNETRSPLLEVVDFGGMPACYTADKKIVLPILLDYGCWSETGARLAHQLLDFKPEGLDIEGYEWFITGSLSPRAKAEAEALGFTITEHAAAPTTL